MTKPRKKYQHISPVAVLKWREAGYTLREIGEYYGVTRQRIFQILQASSKPRADFDVKAWRQKRRERNRIEPMTF